MVFVRRIIATVPRSAADELDEFYVYLTVGTFLT